ncbi:MAG: hypothetical protein IH945_01955 [Armatimonadetes bacterium]|nr:hypothetical protein [Armatimonadota bacterium]
MANPITLTAVNVPLPVVPGAVVYASVQREVTGVPPTSDKYTLAMLEGGYVAADNRNATAQDMQNRYGSGGYAVGFGLGLTSGGDLELEVGKGQATIDGIVEFSADQTVVVPPSMSRGYIWLKQDGTFVVQNATTDKPAGNVVFLGSLVTDASTITSFDDSGIVYWRGGNMWRETNDAGVPGDSPDAALRLITKTQDGSYFWNGARHTFNAGTTVREGLEAARAGVVKGDVFESVDGPFREIFDGTNWNQKGPAMPLVKPAAFSTWTNRGAVEASKSELGGGLYISAAKLASNALVMYNKAAPSTPYTVTFGVIILNWQVATNLGGVCFFEVATGKITTWAFEQANGAVLVNNWTNHTTKLGASTFEGFAQFGPLLWWRIRDTGTFLEYSISTDGRNFELRSQVARGSHFTTAPDEYGFCVNSANANRQAHITVLSVEVT